MMRALSTIAALLFLLPCFGQGQSGRPMVSVDTVADLVARKPVPNERVLLSGFRSAGDFGPQRIVRHDPSSVAATNLGCVYANAGSGRYLAEDCESGEVDVRWFGATGDGTVEWRRAKIGATVPTDDTDAIQAAVDYVGSEQGSKKLMLPAGIYRVTRTIIGRLPQGIQIVGVQGSAATQEVIDDGNQTQWVFSDLVRDGGGDWPLLWLVGSTNSVSDPNYTNFQSGVGFNWSIRDIGLRDKYSSLSTGYDSVPTNTAPLLKISSVVRSRFENIRFGEAHGAHLYAYHADDSVFERCFFNGSGLYVPDWSTRVFAGISVSADEVYDGINSIHFVNCMWEAASYGNFWTGGTAYGVYGIQMLGCFLKTHRPLANYANLHLSRVTDAHMQFSVSGGRAWDDTLPLVTLDQLVYVEGTTSSGNANRGMLELQMNMQHFGNNTNIQYNRLMFITNMSAVKIELVGYGEYPIYGTNWIVVDPTCNRVKVNGVLLSSGGGSGAIGPLVNFPDRDRGMGQFFGDGQYGVGGSTNTEAVGIVDVPLLGTNSYTFWARVKIPPNTGTSKYLGGFSNFYTNQVGGSNSVRLYLDANGEMVWRSAGSERGVVLATTTNFRLFGWRPEEWVDLVWVRTPSTVTMYADGQQWTTTGNYDESLVAERFLFFVDGAAGASVEHWDGKIQRSMLIQTNLTAQQVWRLPFEGPPAGTTILFDHDWRPDGGIVRDYSGNNRHVFLYDGVTVSTGKGGIVRASQTQKIASVPDSGSFLYNTTSNLLEYYNGSAWKVVAALPSGGTSSNFFRGDGVFTNIVPIAPTNNGAYVLFVTNGVASWIAHP